MSKEEMPLDIEPILETHDYTIIEASEKELEEYILRMMTLAACPKHLLFPEE